MPTSAVYQPTTVTYEQQPTEQRYNCPTSYFSRRLWGEFLSSGNMGRWAPFAGGFILSLIGLVLILVGTLKYAYSSDDIKFPEDNGVTELIIGSVFLALALGIMMLNVWCWVTRVAGKDVTAMNGGAGLTALNPSTDPLVAGQYAPVRDAPPAPDDETRNLMDNKDCLSSAEESDKMLEGPVDPVLVA